jgi:hypothetical protein
VTFTVSLAIFLILESWFSGVGEGFKTFPILFDCAPSGGNFLQGLRVQRNDFLLGD